MSTLPNARLDRAIETSNAWLNQQTIYSFLECADRLLIRLLSPSPASHQDAKDILSSQAQLLDVAKNLYSQGKLGMPDVIIVMWAMEQMTGRQLPEWRRFLEPIGRAWANSISVPEPHRSAGLYWAHLAGWANNWQSGAAPTQALHLMYHYTHLIYYKTAYGTNPVDSFHMLEAQASLSQNWRKYTDNPDLTAEVLLAFLALKPLDRELCREVADALLKLQQDNGSFVLVGGDHTHHHHATSVAWLALSRYRKTL